MAAIADATITVGAEPELLEILRDIRDELTIQRELIGRLVALEEDRRSGEQQLETLAAALLPTEDSPAAVDIDALDWRRSRDGRGFDIIEHHTNAIGVRPATPAEAAAIERALKAAKERRR